MDVCSLKAKRHRWCLAQSEQVGRGPHQIGSLLLSTFLKLLGHPSTLLVPRRSLSSLSFIARTCGGRLMGAARLRLLISLPARHMRRAPYAVGYGSGAVPPSSRCLRTSHYGVKVTAPQSF